VSHVVAVPNDPTQRARTLYRHDAPTVRRAA
jgi:hypothetical protein